MKRGFFGDKRGQIRVIEAFFAAVLLLSSLTLIPTVQRLSSEPNGSATSSSALNLLSSLDCDGNLGLLLDQRNWSAVQSCFEAVVSPTVWFNLSVFDPDMVPLNGVAICIGGAVSDHVEAADYLCASVGGGTYAVYVFGYSLRS
ncbi:MAG: hypothetical protein ACBZ72_06140 [Candidatus Bathyarchaeia archaeon]|jgi:hypothetical protein